MIMPKEKTCSKDYSMRWKFMRSSRPKWSGMRKRYMRHQGRFKKQIQLMKKPRRRKK